MLLREAPNAARTPISRVLSVTLPDQVCFIEHLLRWPCYGDPEFTFSDVERGLHQKCAPATTVPGIE
jgi:hypothetical protein